MIRWVIFLCKSTAELRPLGGALAAAKAALLTQTAT
jgi:hypothetical protein